MRDSFRLDGKVALVTGANTGIGQAIAIGLARAGAEVVAAGPRQPERDRPPDAGVGAGDQRPLAVEPEGIAHRRSPIATISTSL